MSVTDPDLHSDVTLVHTLSDTKPNMTLIKANSWNKIGQATVNYRIGTEAWDWGILS